MAEHDSLPIERDFREIIEPRKFLSKFASFLVMVPGECIYLFAANLLPKLRGPRLWADAEISEEVQNVVRFCTRVQPFQNLLVHFLDGLERAIAISNDVEVSKVKVGRKPSVSHDDDYAGMTAALFVRTAEFRVNGESYSLRVRSVALSARRRLRQPGRTLQSRQRCKDRFGQFRHTSFHHRLRKSRLSATCAVNGLNSLGS